MKKLIYYALLMIFVIVMLPLLIIKGCGVTMESAPPVKQQNVLKIKVYVKNENKTKEMSLEEYIKGVVAAEMPAEFGLEALKAQAVAARTYALGRMKRIFTANDNAHIDADVCTDPAHCEAWVLKSEAMKRWGIFSGFKYWNKIDTAVRETENLIITYNGEIINPVFHSNSGGMTENTEDVWPGDPIPYLKSVISEGEESSKEYEKTILIKTKTFYDNLKKVYPEIKLNINNLLKEISVLSLTAGGRVDTIKIGTISMKGTEFRKIFSLNSANFKIEEKDSETLSITTLGNGHGVGMSQWGASYLAKCGGNFEEILKYYYTGVEISNINLHIN